MNGLILVNAYAEPVQTRQVMRIKSELEKLGCAVKTERNNAMLASVCGGKAQIAARYDFCVFLDKDKYASHLLEKSGVRLFNSAAAIETCDDKMTTHIALSECGLPMPDTLPGLLCYDADLEYPKSTLDKVECTLGYPVIAKFAYGSMGKGVFKAENRAELDTIAEKLKMSPHLFQRYVSSSYGRDMRVIVVGGHALGAIIRKSNCDFRSNIGLGGHAEKAMLPSDAERLATTAATALGLDYCGIDLLFGKSGFLLCEVNSNAFFDAFEDATGINVAGHYARHILDAMK